MEMTPQRWSDTSAYINSLYSGHDARLDTLMSRAVAAGLPEIAVDAGVGQMLRAIASGCNNGAGAQVIVEVGALAGYSGLWLAGGLTPTGHLYTIEISQAHAEFARREFFDAGLADRIQVIEGAALDALPDLMRRLGAESIDVAFLDAEKVEYAEYASILGPSIRQGGYLIADNALGANWWITDPEGSSAARDAIAAFNRSMTQDPHWVTWISPIREGVLIARKR